MFSGGWQRLVESQIFFPEAAIIQTPADAGLPFEDQWITTADGVKLHGWLVPQRLSGELILFFTATPATSPTGWTTWPTCTASAWRC